MINPPERGHHYVPRSAITINQTPPLLFASGDCANVDSIRERNAYAFTLVTEAANSYTASGQKLSQHIQKN